MRFPVLVFLALSAGCTTIGHEKVAGWPTLQIVEHRVPHHVMRDRCVQYVGFGMSPEACAEFDFDRKRCDLWFSADFPPPSYIVEHERLHCLGYEHAGEEGLKEAWDRYVAARNPAGATTLATRDNSRR